MVGSDLPVLRKCLARKVTPEDRALLDRVHLLHSTLTQRAVLLSHLQSNMDIFIEGMRDLGQDLQKLGTEILQRVIELDAAPD